MTTTKDAIEESYLVLATVGGKNLLVRRDVLTRPHRDLGIQSYFSRVCQLGVSVLFTTRVVHHMCLVPWPHPVYDHVIS